MSDDIDENNLIQITKYNQIFSKVKIPINTCIFIFFLLEV